MSTKLTSAMRRAFSRNIRQRKGMPRDGNSSFHQLLSPRFRGAQHETSRYYGAAAVEDSNADGNNNSYVSPFQEIFDTIQEGKTFLGTTEFQYPTKKFLKCGIPENQLKYKTTTYGRLLEAPYVRANEHRVVLQVALRHIPLTDLQKAVLKEIVGNRLNDETGILQLSSTQFGSRIENKRHVVSMLERAVESAKSLAAKIGDEQDASKA